MLRQVGATREASGMTEIGGGPVAGTGFPVSDARRDANPSRACPQYLARSLHPGPRPTAAANWPAVGRARVYYTSHPDLDVLQSVLDGLRRL